MVKKVQIKINGTVYPSIKEATKSMGWNTFALQNAISKGKTTCKGVPFERIEQTKDTYSTTESTTKARNFKKQSCPVLCTTTGKIYNTITKAAKAAGVPMWTMSVKMAGAGKFIDKEGNEYIRQKPMKKRSERDYGKQTSKITRVLTRKYHKNPEKIQGLVITKVEQSVPTITKNMNLSTEEKECLTFFAKTSLDNKDYQKASCLLNILARNS